MFFYGILLKMFVVLQNISLIILVRAHFFIGSVIEKTSSLMFDLQCDDFHKKIFHRFLVLKAPNCKLNINISI